MVDTVVSENRIERQGGVDLRVVLAFLAIYILWGTTFLAIRVAVQEIPPLLAAGLRMFLAGLILSVWMWLRGAARPTALEWRNLAALGLLLFVVDYGPIFWAEKYVRSEEHTSELQSRQYLVCRLLLEKKKKKNKYQNCK